MVPFLAGLIEFALCGLMFLMAAFAITGWLVLSYLPTLHVAAAEVEFLMGILAIVAFVFALAGSASAIMRWSVLLPVIGAALVAFWGLLENWYALTFLNVLGDIQISVTFGTVAIFFSMLVIIMVVVSRQHFKLRALARALHD